MPSATLTPPATAETSQARAATRPTVCRQMALQAQSGRDWDQYVKAHPQGSVFHLTAWHDAVRSSFGHKPFFLQAMRGRDIVGVLPMFLVRSRLAGRMLVSVPYGVTGGVLANDTEASDRLVASAKSLVGETQSTLLDLRSRDVASSALATRDRYVTFDRVLPDCADQVLSWLPRKARAAARNGRNKFGLSASWDTRQLRTVWRLYAINMRRIGSLAYPYGFFRNIVSHPGLTSWVTLILWRGAPVAGLVSLLYKDRVMPYFFGASNRAKRFSAANFAYLVLMERAVAAGYRVFDFGRTRVDNQGSFDFKRFHGFTPTPLHYQFYVPEGCAEPDLSPSNPRYRLVRRIWPRLPLVLTQVLGARLAKHIPG